MTDTIYRFWYSEKQANVYEDEDELFQLLDLLRELHGIPPRCRNFVTLLLEGEPIEVEYTECTSADSHYWPTWDDAILLGEAPISHIRIEELTERVQ